MFFSLASILQTNAYKKSGTFTTFVDFKKAFDLIDRETLFYKLLQNGIDGKMYWSVKSMYSDTISNVKVNKLYTDWFSINTLSPTFCSLFINDLAKEIKAAGYGISVGNDKVPILLYANDIALLSESEDDMQNMLNIVYAWCRKWRLEVNCSKTKVMHFRKKNLCRSQYVFHLGETPLNYEDHYKYLGVILEEHLDFNTCAETLGAAGGRALGSVISKFKSIKNMGFSTFSFLYNAGVIPVTDYCAGVWGHKLYQKTEAVQKHALRFYIGVHKFAPIPAIEGDVGWLPTYYRHKLEIIRLWNRLILMDNSRLAKKIFLCNYSNPKVNDWPTQVRRIFESMGELDIYNNVQVCDISYARNILFNNYAETWHASVMSKPKLRIYREFKTNYGLENYIVFNLSRQERSYLAQFRCGILPLRVETGRFKNEPLSERKCMFCDQESVEDEFHFILHCPKYNIERQNLLEIYLSNLVGDNVAKLNALMQQAVRPLAKYIHKAFQKRREALYVS